MLDYKTFTNHHVPLICWLQGPPGGAGLPGELGRVGPIVSITAPFDRHLLILKTMLLGKANYPYCFLFPALPKNNRWISFQLIILMGTKDNNATLFLYSDFKIFPKFSAKIFLPISRISGQVKKCYLYFIDSVVGPSVFQFLFFCIRLCMKCRLKLLPCVFILRSLHYNQINRM